MFHKNPLPAEDSHEISSLSFSEKQYKNIYVVCCSCDWLFQGYHEVSTSMWEKFDILKV